MKTTTATTKRKRTYYVWHDPMTQTVNAASTYDTAVRHGGGDACTIQARSIAEARQIAQRQFGPEQCFDDLVNDGLSPDDAADIAGLCG